MVAAVTVLTCIQETVGPLLLKALWTALLEKRGLRSCDLHSSCSRMNFPTDLMSLNKRHSSWMNIKFSKSVCDESHWSLCTYHDGSDLAHHSFFWCRDYHWCWWDIKKFWDVRQRYEILTVECYWQGFLKTSACERILSIHFLHKLKVWFSATLVENTVKLTSSLLDPSIKTDCILY